MTTTTDAGADTRTDSAWLRRLLEGALRQPTLVLMLVVVGGVAGVDAFRGLRRDVFPDLSAPVFNVIAQNAAMSAEELERSIAIPLETALSGLPQVRRVRSSSQLGVVQVTVELEPDADATRSRQLIAERIGEVSARLPAGTDPPLLSSVTGRLNEIFELTIEAAPGTVDLMGLRDLAEGPVKNRLLAVPGVAAVERLGGFLRQMQVRIDPERMTARQVTLDEVLHAVEGSNAGAAGGFYVQGPLEWSIRVDGRATIAEELQAVAVAVRGETPVLLGDVADVREAPAVRRGLAHRLAGEVVSCRVTKQFGADTVATAAGLRAAMASLQKGVPEGVELRLVYDQSALIDEALSGVSRAVLVGAVFVVLVIVLLLGNLRAALLVTLSLPLSMALAALLLQRFDVGLNTMTLGGLAIAVGLLVDASIIMTENIVHRLGQGGSVVDAAAEVGRPIAFATFVVCAVFFPLFAMTGIEGRMYAPLALAVIASMAAALVLALTFTPVAAAYLLVAGSDHDPRAVAWLKGRYGPLLDRILVHPRKVVVVAVVVVVAAGGSARSIGSDFLPALDEGALLLQTNLPAEASLHEVDLWNHRVEDVLRSFPEVDDVVRRTGRAERTEDPMPHTLSDVLVVLKADRQRSTDELEDAMRAALDDVPGISVSFTTPLGMRIDEGLGGSPADLIVRVQGDDLAVLGAVAADVERLVSAVEGTADVRAERGTLVPGVSITVDRPAVARAGLTPGDVVDAMRVMLVGQEGPEILRGNQRTELVVLLDEQRRSDIDALRGILIDTHHGGRVPLGLLARIEPKDAPGSIRREGGLRRLAVEASVSGRDLKGVADDVRASIDANLKLPAGVFVDVGGRVESQERANAALLRAALLAAFSVFLLLMIALGSARDAGLIVGSVPLALVGGVGALLVSGETWNVSSLVGLIGLFGIAVQNALVLVSQVRAQELSGVGLVDAIRSASVQRVRPKLMTAATAILGLLPLLVLRLQGTEIERPLAIVMVGGLLTSTLYTLVVLPAVLALSPSSSSRR
ncbi:MAG: efflux RND transporter permease subunit [Deltaproteobacteria bacterium]|nr:efflux RND transporter permease subunit [Deltaproteobacteria bacterium]